VEAAYARWTTGGRVHADDRKRPRFLKPLVPRTHEVWTIRITEPNVQLRSFCRFAAPNVLVVSHTHTRPLLDGVGAWDDAIAACKATWDALIPDFAPFSAGLIQQYVTEACDDFPI
jgi:hypothetical protein